MKLAVIGKYVLLQIRWHRLSFTVPRLSNRGELDVVNWQEILCNADKEPMEARAR